MVPPFVVCPSNQGDSRALLFFFLILHIQVSTNLQIIPIQYFSNVSTFLCLSFPGID